VSLAARKSPFASARSTRQQATIPIRDDGGLRLAVVADTHGRPHPDGARLIAAQRPDAILHAGDIGELSVLDTLREIAPLVCVRGNIDGHAENLPDLVDVDLVFKGQDRGAPLLRILLLHIGVNGPKLRADAARLARECGAKLVICGHSHVPFIGRDRNITIFNPGSIGPRRFALPIVFGMLVLDAGRFEPWHVDCETGQRWAPPGG
jgi:putative phosphoesterase